MAKTNKKYRKTSTASEALLAIATVLSVVEKVKYKDGKIKLTFECKTNLGYLVRCVYWSNININEGDSVTMKGRFNNDVFLVWNILITERSAREQESEKERTEK